MLVVARTDNFPTCCCGGGRLRTQETEKLALAETTGLDQKQINNWFINQRKRHWKPASEDMPFAMVEAAGGFHAPQGTAAAAAVLYMADGMYRLGS